jgi:hypothetical protein
MGEHLVWRHSVVMGIGAIVKLKIACKRSS